MEVLSAHIQSHWVSELGDGWWGESFHSSFWKVFILPPPSTLTKASEHQLLPDSVSFQVQELHWLFNGPSYWRESIIHPLFQENVVKDITSQDDVTGLLWLILQCSLRSIWATEPSRGFSKSSQSHCGLQNGPYFSCTLLGFQQYEVES